MQCYIAIILFPNKAEKYIIKVQDTNNQGVKCPLSVKGLFNQSIKVLCKERDNTNNPILMFKKVYL